MKLATAELAATDAVAGTVILPVEVKGMGVVAATGALRVTVQTAAAPGESDEGVQEIPVRTGITIAAAAVPPVALTVIWLPASEAPMAPELPIAAEPAEGASEIDTEATVPLAMMLVLIPVARQV